MSLKTYLKKVGLALATVGPRILWPAFRAFGTVIHDPKVDRAAKAFAALIVVRVVLALGGSVEIANLIGKLLG